MAEILPDLVCAWPQHMDYPLWRQQLRNNRDKFNKVIVIFTNMNVNDNYRHFLTQAMYEDNVMMMPNDIVTGEEDWRNVAMRKALKYVESDWIWFTEQDFFFKDGFWDTVKEQMKKVGYIRAMVGDRMHPCCVFIKRFILQQTSMNFGVIRDVSDHFSVLQKDLERVEHFDIPNDLWTHLGGLSQNMFLLMNGESNFYMPNEFDKYILDCLEVSVPLHPNFKSLLESYIRIE